MKAVNNLITGLLGVGLLLLAGSCSEAGAGSESSDGGGGGTIGAITGSGSISLDGQVVGALTYGDVEYESGQYLYIYLLGMNGTTSDADSISFDIPTTATTLQAGTYSVDLEGGVDCVDCGVVLIDYSIADAVGTAAHMGDVDSGEVVVTKSGETYTITFTVTTHNYFLDEQPGAHTVTGSYTGTLEHYPYEE